MKSWKNGTRTFQNCLSSKYITEKFCRKWWFYSHVTLLSFAVLDQQIWSSTLKSCPCIHRKGHMHAVAVALCWFPGVSLNEPSLVGTHKGEGRRGKSCLFGKTHLIFPNHSRGQGRFPGRSSREGKGKLEGFIWEVGAKLEFLIARGLFQEAGLSVVYQPSAGGSWIMSPLSTGLMAPAPAAFFQECRAHPLWFSIELVWPYLRGK